MIENWVATETQITAADIVRRLAAIDPATFGNKQYSIVRRLIRSLRRKLAETVLMETAEQMSIQTTVRLGPVDGASYGGHSAPPTGPLAELVTPLIRAGMHQRAGNIPS